MSDLKKRLNAAYEDGMFNEDWDDLDGVCALMLEAGQRIAALEAFKSYVHERLDGMGIPVDPPGEHSDAGCRVGQRLDVVEDRIAALEAALGEAKRECIMTPFCAAKIEEKSE